MTSLSPWQEAWNGAQTQISAIRSMLNPETLPGTRVIRIGQLDAELLDQELLQLLQEPLGKALSSINTSLKARFESELTLLIHLILYKLSIWNTGASYGAKLQDLRYTTPPAQGRALATSGLPRLTLLLHGTMTVVLPYLHTKLRSHALSSAWPDAPSSDRRRKAWDILTTLESYHTLLAASNFIAFLWNGRFRTIADRLVKMSLAPSRRIIKRDVSYEFMNRQMVWHAFTEFLLFLLPLINARSIRRRISQVADHITSLKLLTSYHSPSKDPKNGVKSMLQRRGKFWALPQDQCAICAENASLSLNLSETSNAFTAFTATVNETPPTDSETDPPAFPIYNPYLASCGDLYCYHCIAERLMQEDAGIGWTCLRCGMAVKSADRYTIEQGGDVAGSDYEWSSDISESVSLASYSESGRTDSSVS